MLMASMASVPMPVLDVGLDCNRSKKIYRNEPGRFAFYCPDMGSNFSSSMLREGAQSQYLAQGRDLLEWGKERNNDSHHRLDTLLEKK
jgi:hypothetical protein